MKKVLNTIELAEGGYVKLEGKILDIEKLAHEGMFSDKDAVSRFQEIFSEAKNLRQLMREVLLISPAALIRQEPKDAA